VKRAITAFAFLLSVSSVHAQETIIESRAESAAIRHGILKRAAHQTPDFYLDESGMKTGIKAFRFLVLDYMKLEQAKPSNKSQQNAF